MGGGIPIKRTGMYNIESFFPASRFMKCMGEGVNSLFFFSFSSFPLGWLMCNNQAQSSLDYQKLNDQKI